VVAKVAAVAADDTPVAAGAVATAGGTSSTLGHTPAVTQVGHPMSHADLNDLSCWMYFVFPYSLHLLLVFTSAHVPGAASCAASNISGAAGALTAPAPAVDDAVVADVAVWVAVRVDRGAVGTSTAAAAEAAPASGISISSTRAHGRPEPPVILPCAPP